MFWALDKNHPFKLAINNRFQEGKEYQPKTISATINETLKIFYHRELPHNTAVFF